MKSRKNRRKATNLLGALIIEVGALLGIVATAQPALTKQWLQSVVRAASHSPKQTTEPDTFGNAWSNSEARFGTTTPATAAVLPPPLAAPHNYNLASFHSPR